MFVLTWQTYSSSTSVEGIKETVMFSTRPDRAQCYRNVPHSHCLCCREIRKRVFAPRRGTVVERVSPLHFAVSAGAESFILRRGLGRSAWLTPSLLNPLSPACAAILMARRYSSISMGSPKETPPVTLMNDRATTVSSISAPLCVTGRKKRPAMMMAVVSARSIPKRRRPVNGGAQFSVSVEALFTW